MEVRTWYSSLSGAELERLALLSEECGEVIQVIGKILRHGFLSTHPKDKKLHPTTNKEMLEKEIGDVLAAIDKLCKAEDVDEKVVNVHRLKKHQTVNQYLHYEVNKI